MEGTGVKVMSMGKGTGMGTGMDMGKDQGKDQGMERTSLGPWHRKAQGSVGEVVREETEAWEA